VETKIQDSRAHTRRLEHWVHYSLLVGLLLSGLLLIAGLAMALARHEVQPAGPPVPLAVVLRGALSGDGVACLNLGLLALMLTPVLRVCVLVVGWSLAGERHFALVALSVLALLGLSVVLGFG
jgi:uncharacterized membrane protein